MNSVWTPLCVLLIAVLTALACSTSAFVIFTPLIAAAACWILIDPDLEADSVPPAVLFRRVRQRIRARWITMGRVARSVRISRIQALAVSWCGRCLAAVQFIGRALREKMGRAQLVLSGNKQSHMLEEFRNGS
jgi:hypothetical protein